MLIDAWRRVQDVAPDWELAIVGWGLQKAAMAEMQRHASAIERATRFRSGLRRVSAVYAAADAFVLPTHSENFGISVAEALAHGVPAIVTKGAPWGGLETNRCGWWIDIGAEPLADRLRAVLSTSPEERRGGGARGRVDWLASDHSLAKRRLRDDGEGWLSLARSRWESADVGSDRLTPVHQQVHSTPTENSAASDVMRSPHGLKNKLARVAWWLVWTLLYRPSPRPCHAWRRMLLRLFGATIGRDAHPYAALLPHLGCRGTSRWAARSNTVIASIAIASIASSSARMPSLARTRVSARRPTTFASRAFGSSLGRSRSAGTPGLPPGRLSRRAASIERCCSSGEIGLSPKDVPDWTVVAGNPARPIGTRPPSACEE